MTSPWPDFDTFPVVAHGHRYGDFTLGREFRHHWGRTLTEADNVIFSTATCTWSPMYLNREYAAAHAHPGVVVNPMLVLCTVVGLSVEDLSEAGGPFLGIDGCEFLAEVYVGDTLDAQSVVVGMRESGSRPTHGIVTWETTGVRQDGEPVLRFRRSNLVVKG